MSGQLRELKNRVKSVENTKKITRAMEMVAAAKLRRFQSIMENAKPYTEELEKQMKRLHTAQKNLAKKSGGSKGGSLHPFFEERAEEKIALVFMTSDTGLCGSYNLDLINQAKNFLKNYGPDNRPQIIGIGKSGITALEFAGYRVNYKITDLRASRVEEILKEYKTCLEDLYTQKKADAIYVIYSHFETMSNFKGVTEKLLPLEEPQSDGEETASDTDYIFEPSPEAIFSQLVPLFFESKTRMIFLEALVSEQIARMNAMHQATENAKEMIEDLVLQRNKARQASITKEIIEIVSGSQAAKNN